MRLEGVPGVEASGPALAYLAQQHDAATGHRQWIVKNRWLQIDMELGLLSIAVMPIRELWRMARFRFTRWPNPRDGLHDCLHTT